MTYGATVWNGITIIVGSFVTSFVCWLVSLGQVRAPIGDDLIIPILFVLVFSFQYLEFPPLGKKVGLSIVALNIIQLPTNDGEFIWVKIN